MRGEKVLLGGREVEENDLQEPERGVQFGETRKAWATA
jgi:hypothetical protein